MYPQCTCTKYSSLCGWLSVFINSKCICVCLCECVSEHASLRHQFSRHVALPSRRGETCGKLQLWRVKTFFMDEFLWHSWGTGEAGWEVNELGERRGRRRWRGKFFCDKRRRKCREKTAEEIRGLECHWGKIKRKKKCCRVCWEAVLEWEGACEDREEETRSLIWSLPATVVQKHLFIVPYLAFY